MSAEWVRVDPAEFDQEETREHRGVHFTVFLSPYDLPDGVRGWKDEKGPFFIEFKYITSGERTRAQHVVEFVTLHLGKNSGRLYKIEVDVDARGAKSVELNAIVAKAIDKIKNGNKQRASKYDVAKRVLEARKDEVYKDLSTAA